MNIIFVSSEVYPFQKHGGLADISASLPKTLNQKGLHIKTILPLYEDDEFQNEYQLFKTKTVQFGQETIETSYYTYTFENHEYIYVKNSLLSALDPNETFLTFVMFNVSVLSILKDLGEPVDLLHINDWHTSFIPFLLDSMFRPLDPFYENIKTLLTIHNLERQGQFDRHFETYLPYKNFTYILNGHINFLKTGIMRANYINTVSRTYKQEILLRFYGFDLDSALKARQDHLEGILNGFDHHLYDPTTSKTLYINYDLDTYEKGKAYNKSMFLKSLDLKDDTLPLMLFNGRLGRQKGIDIMKSSLEDALSNASINLVIVGEGEAKYETYFKDLERKYKDHIHFFEGFNQTFSEKAYAASDFFLLPSLFEPSGLNHLIAMRYGSLPIVRETGGLKDTVFSKGPKHNGFTFINYDEQEFQEIFLEAISYFYEKNPLFHEKITHAMQVTSHLEDMAENYIHLYQKVMNEE